MPAHRRGESAAGLLFLVVVLVALVRGCGSAPRREPPRREPAEVQRMHDLSRSVDALRGQNAELMADRGRAPMQAFPENLRGAQLGVEIRRRVQQSGHSGHVHVSVDQTWKNGPALEINDTALFREGNILWLPNVTNEPLRVVRRAKRRG